MAAVLRVLDPVTPTEAESQLAETSSRALSGYVRDEEGQTITVLPEGANREQAVRIPAVAFRLLVNILTQMAKGNAITLIPVHAELTTQEAADLLNVSRPYLIKLLDNGAIDHQMTGNRRKIRFCDLMDYKRKSLQDRSKALDELAELSEELGLGQ